MVRIGKNSRVLVAAIIGIFAVLVCMSCEDKILTAGRSTEAGSYDAVVCFIVNDARTGFVNVGTGTGYTATANGGTFTTSSGRNVYSTGGTDTGGTWVIPWFSPNTWPKYTGQGHVQLNQATADLIASSEEWTVETIFALPSDHRADIVDQYVWGFYGEEDSNGFPTTILGLCWREVFMRIIPGYDDVAMPSGGWGGTRAIAGAAVGAWAHVVVTKTSGGTITIYVNGDEFINNQTIDYPSSYTTGGFPRAWLGKTPYPIGGAMEGGEPPVALPAEGTYGDDLVNTGYYQFAIDDKAWDAAEVKKRYGESPMGKGQMYVWNHQ